MADMRGAVDMAPVADMRVAELTAARVAVMPADLAATVAEPVDQAARLMDIAAVGTRAAEVVVAPTAASVAAAAMAAVADTGKI